MEPACRITVGDPMDNEYNGSSNQYHVGRCADAVEETSVWGLGEIHTVLRITSGQ